MSCQTLSNKFLEDINNLYDITDDYNVKIQVWKRFRNGNFQAHSVILQYIYTGTILGNIENNIIELLLVANEMELYELVEYLQQCIINFNNDWIELNGVKLYDFISHHKGVFPKLQELCNNIMSQKPKLLIDSNEFWGLDDEALLSMIQLDYLEMKEVEIWDNLNKMGKLYQNLFNIFDFFQMTSQEYYCKVRPLSKLLPKELEEDLLSHYIVPEYKLATKVLPPRKSQNDKIFDSTILTRKYFNIISYWIDNGQEKLPKFTESFRYKYNLLLRGSRDGFESKDFNSKCNNKGATIVIIKLKDSNKIIGGYNPIIWSKHGSCRYSDKSFIFSFYLDTLDLNTIVLSRVVDCNNAIMDSDQNNHGFGWGDLFIFRKSCKLTHYSAKNS
ncbi:unnamed protein product [Rhizophagus irregularis]|nr:unnamed protein product [Rhizophagus irregularis]